MEEKKTTVMHEFNPSQQTRFFTGPVFVFLLICVVLGGITGYMVTHTQSFQAQQASLPNGSSSIQKGAIFGSTDTSTFKDNAEGILQKGGIGDEGQYHLVRPGGPSQHVYLTSSVVDLAQFINRKIKVFGQTQKAQTAGWLMDIGRVEVLE